MPRRGSWHSSPPIMSPPLLIILLPIITLTLLFLTVPPLLSATSHVLRPTSVVKSSWDSLNILLVVFAILVGVFARRNDDESPHHPHQEETANDAVPRNNVMYNTMSSGEEAGSYVSQPWFGFSEEKKVYDATPIRYQPPATGVTRLRRSSSSYPDLRQWETGDDRYKFRFFDDFEIDKLRSTPPREQAPAVVDSRKRWPEAEGFEEGRVKEIPVDTFEISSSSPPPPKSPAVPPPPPPPPPLRRKTRRTHQKVDGGGEITEHDENEFTRIRTPPLAPPPPPSPSVKTRSEHNRRKSNVKREIAMVWASVLSKQRKRKKKQRTKSDHNHHYDNVDELTNITTAPPPPPPPPPPPSVFQSLFRKGLGKNKKIHSVSTPPPPPPPPPLTSSRRWSKRNSQIPPPPPEPLQRRNSGRPPLPNKVSNLNVETINNDGNRSPLIPVPPPPPPFKMPAMKFVVRGDFVKIHSNHSSLCSSPEREDIDVSTTMQESEMATVAAAAAASAASTGEVGGSVFCPSPDVNIKAATFIAKLRGKWKLEKINSMKEKGNDGNGPSLHVTSYNL